MQVGERKLSHSDANTAIIQAMYTDRLWETALKGLQELRQKEDRETEENKFIPTRTVFGAARSRNNFQGGAWPYNYPRP